MELPDWANQYQSFAAKGKDWKPTTLSEKEEPKFRKWFYNTKLFNNLKGLIQADYPEEKLTNDQIAGMLMQQGDYDYRGAYKAGIKEEISPYDNMPHWPDADSKGNFLKSPSHPTAWKEFFMQKYQVDPDAVGLDTYDKAVAASLQGWQPPIENLNYQDPFGDTTK